MMLMGTLYHVPVTLEQVLLRLPDGSVTANLQLVASCLGLTKKPKEPSHEARLQHLAQYLLQHSYQVLQSSSGASDVVVSTGTPGDEVGWVGWLHARGVVFRGLYGSNWAYSIGKGGLQIFTFKAVAAALGLARPPQVCHHVVACFIVRISSIVSAQH